MKNTLFAIALISFVSCTKKPACPPVPPAPTANTLKGCWFGNYGASICFTDSLISKDRDFFYPYSTSTDTIYWHFDDGSKYAQYHYVLVNDTLRLYPTLLHPDAPFTYWR
jgi:hypothetical protein